MASNIGCSLKVTNAKETCSVSASIFLRIRKFSHLKILYNLPLYCNILWDTFILPDKMRVCMVLHVRSKTFLENCDENTIYWVNV